MCNGYKKRRLHGKQSQLCNSSWRRGFSCGIFLHIWLEPVTHTAKAACFAIVLLPNRFWMAAAALDFSIASFCPPGGTETGTRILNHWMYSNSHLLQRADTKVGQGCGFDRLGSTSHRHRRRGARNIRTTVLFPARNPSHVLVATVCCRNRAMCIRFDIAIAS